tara:strand:+ start:740 stop:1036 length:297 start_codon:yes stop_codon:yes gene_type:complete
MTRNKLDPDERVLAGLYKERDIVMYSTSGCGYCRMAVELFQRANIPYTEYKVGQHLTKEDVRAKLGVENLTFPQVYYKGEHLGGLIDTAKYFQDNGFV